jgi:serine/threonine protein kinase
MAPEILFGRPYDAKVDLWSTGVIFYEMIYGVPPYSSRTIDEMLKKVRENQAIIVRSLFYIHVGLTHELWTRRCNFHPVMGRF